MRWSEYDEIYLEPRHKVDDAIIQRQQLEEMERRHEAAIEEMERAADEF